MRLTKTIFAAGLALAAYSGSTPAQGADAPPPAPQGVWMWEDGRVGVEFHPCADALCGRIVWLKQESGADGAAVLDSRNPDAALRNRRVCGLDYITGVRRAGDGRWKGGKVYDFNSGRTYDLDIDQIGKDRVTMRGYKSVRLLGANLVLVRPATELPRCPAAGAA